MVVRWRFMVKFNDYSLYSVAYHHPNFWLRNLCYNPWIYNYFEGGRGKISFILMLTLEYCINFRISLTLKTIIYSSLILELNLKQRRVRALNFPLKLIFQNVWLKPDLVLREMNLPSFYKDWLQTISTVWQKRFKIRGLYFIHISYRP